MKDNLKIWEKVDKTDSGFTKPMGFGANLTAIDQMYQFKNATRMFGSFGIGWGTINENYQVIDGFVIYTAELWYKYDGEKGQFPISSDHKFKDDCIKSVQTDAITKGLSRIGFNADIFLGTFDGNKYVSKSAPKPAPKPTPKKVEPKPTPEVPGNPDKDKIYEIGDTLFKLPLGKHKDENIFLNDNIETSYLKFLSTKKSDKDPNDFAFDETIREQAENEMARRELEGDPTLRTQVRAGNKKVAEANASKESSTPPKETQVEEELPF